MECQDEAIFRRWHRISSCHAKGVNLKALCMVSQVACKNAASDGPATGYGSSGSIVVVSEGVGWNDIDNRSRNNNGAVVECAIVMGT
jgi:hypothetical protein